MFAVLIVLLCGTLLYAFQSKILCETRKGRKFNTKFSLKMSSFASPSSSSELLSSDKIAFINAMLVQHGMVYSDGHSSSWTTAPISILPNPYPAKAFNSVQQAQLIWNKLIDKLSRDKEFLMKELSVVAQADENFTLRLLNLFETIPESVLSSQIQLGILRSDYMLDKSSDGTYKPLQVEINTISTSLMGLSENLKNFHHTFLKRYGHSSEILNYAQEFILPFASEIDTAKLHERILENDSCRKSASVIAAAHAAYSKGMLVDDESYEKVVLFIVQPNEKNVRGNSIFMLYRSYASFIVLFNANLQQGDQRALDLELLKAHGVAAEFATFHEVAQFTIFTADGRLLFKRSGALQEISVVYFRGGYTPNDYTSEEVAFITDFVEHFIIIYVCQCSLYFVIGLASERND